MMNKLVPFKTCSPILSGEQNCHSLASAEKITMSFDWIEFTGTLTTETLNEHPFLFSYEKQEHGTPYFKELYKIKTIKHGFEMDFATIELRPRPSFLDGNLCRVKLNNRFCYSSGLGATIAAFCREFGITFKHYTRLDYALDFQRVAGYGDLIQQLLHDFASRKLILKGRSMKVFTTVSSYTGITWGSRSSGLSMTLYNKTAEMKKKSSKPYINALWNDAGFDEEKDTYRLEFSTKKPKNDIVSADGETLGSYADIDFLDNFNEYVNYLYHNYFKVAWNVPGTRFSRLKMYSPLQLFIQPTIFKPQTVCIKPQSTNIKKTIIKSVIMEASFLQKEGKKVEASYAWELALNYVEKYSLQRWFRLTFERLSIKSCFLSHYDIMHSDCIKKHMLKQAAIILN